MSQRIKTAVYYLSQLLMLVIVIATGLPARADDSLPRMTADSIASLTVVCGPPESS